MTRNPNMREAILSAAELLFSTHGFNAVSIRDIALEAGANPGSVTYHFKSKDGLLLEIYQRHCGPMNKRRIELLVAARRVRDVQDRLEAIVRAYVQPAFSSSSDLAGGGARFTRLRAVMSAEGNAVVRPHHRGNLRRHHQRLHRGDRGEPAASAAHDDRVAIAVPARRALLHPRQSRAGDAAVARRSRRRRHGGSDRADSSRRRSPRCSASDVDHVDGGRRAEGRRRQGGRKTRLTEFAQTHPARSTLQKAPCTSRRFPDLIPIRERRSSSCRRLPAMRIRHIFGPGDKYPYAPDRPYTPPDAPLEDFRALHRKLGVGRAVIVNASVHGTDNRVALDAIAVERRRLSRGRQYRRHHHRARPSRTARRRFSRLPLQLRAPSRRRARHSACSTASIAMVAPLGWHIDLHFDAIDLPEYADMLAKTAGALHHRSYGAGQGRPTGSTSFRSGR